MKRKTPPKIDDIINQRFKKIEGDIADIKLQLLTEGPTTVLRALESDKRESDKQFAAIDERFNKVDKRFGKMDKRFDKIETTLKEHGEQLTEILSILKRGGP